MDGVGIDNGVEDQAGTGDPAGGEGIEGRGKDSRHLSVMKGVGGRTGTIFTEIDDGLPTDAMEDGGDTAGVVL